MEVIHSHLGACPAFQRKQALCDYACLFGEFLSCNLWPPWPVSIESGECRASNVCRKRWLDRYNQCHCEGEDGSTSVVLPQTPLPGSQAPVSWQLGAVRWAWSYDWFGGIPRAAQRPDHGVLPPCLSSVWGHARNSGQCSPINVTEKKCFTSVTIITFLLPSNMKKPKERPTQAWGVTAAVTAWEGRSDCRWALCLLLFISLLNYSCYPWWPRSPMSDFTAWLLFQGHWWSYMRYLWSHAVLSDFALMQVIMSAWL